jgi:hypothetical protein
MYHQLAVVATPHHITLGERERGGAAMGGKNPTPKEKKKPKKAKTAKA